MRASVPALALGLCLGCATSGRDGRGDERRGPPLLRSMTSRNAAVREHERGGPRASREIVILGTAPDSYRVVANLEASFALDDGEMQDGSLPEPVADELRRLAAEAGGNAVLVDAIDSCSFASMSSDDPDLVHTFALPEFPVVVRGRIAQID